MTPVSTVAPTPGDPRPETIAADVEAPEVRDLIARLTASNEDPVLESGDLDALVALARRPDATGVTFGADGWVETYDYNAAVAEGWRIKAARAANRFNFGEDGQTFQRAQVYANCVKQVQEYARRSMGSIPYSDQT